MVLRKIKYEISASHKAEDLYSAWDALASIKKISMPLMFLSLYNSTYLWINEMINRNMGCIEIWFLVLQLQELFGLIETWDVLK